VAFLGGRLAREMAATRFSWCHREMKAGQRVGADFRLVEPLGEQVWKAERISSDERLAIRFGPEAIRESAGERARFAEMAQRAQAIDSSRAVEIVGFGLSEDGRPYLVMEWLEGETLADRVSRERTLGRSTLVAVLRQLAEALDAAHAEGVVHGALEPGRVFLRAGSEVRVKVLDLGTSRDRRDGGYASPEVLAERGPSQDDDRWSLAAIAYRALTGRRPFAGSDAVAKGRFAPPSELSPTLSKDVDRWFARAFARRAEARFGSTEAMIDTLEETLRAPKPRPSRLLPLVDGLVLVTTGLAALLAGALAALFDGF
jgi:eukaryotic-like serine/threonine-protein kinase